eukprot:CAMPEP_0173313102 /NCGR_PEP_ID=MMETSP1143-20121109/24548_1 /TAXON_ID=483371 /ORGANISM="non described non described, Strain CCMP2298" /LENGTH=69 /DNA_ID=CAMNT_0014255465 /DNA_START=61 /DNA_END=267 /DNA_ORIENTATION=+
MNTEEISIKRFAHGGGDGDVVLFRSDRPINPLRKATPGDTDLLDYVRQAEQKLKLEKLKWHEFNARLLV